jgi:hypothetical protein
MIPEETSDIFDDLEYPNWAAALDDAESARRADLDIGWDYIDAEDAAKAAMCRTVGHSPQLACCGGAHRNEFTECANCGEVTVFTGGAGFRLWLQTGP